ncbi:hypothetical protein V1515DRAFT_592126 [Lipomyces mesembrius]
MWLLSNLPGDHKSKILLFYLTWAFICMRCSAAIVSFRFCRWWVMYCFGLCILGLVYIVTKRNGDANAGLGNVRL